LRYYPIGLNLRGKAVIITGAGHVAERKARAFLAAGANITLIAPEATPFLLKASKKERVSLIKRGYRRGDLKGADLVIAATSDAAVNRRVAEDARKRRIWVNVADDTVSCEFIFPAVIKRKGIIISVSSNGKDPCLSRDLKIFLKENWDVFLSYRGRL